MAGNSWLAICQIYAVSLNPPHLCAIAPWECGAYFYEDGVCRGGIPGAEFARSISNLLRIGEDGLEDVRDMLLEHPSFEDPYWQVEKAPKPENITVPAYVVASYSSNVHTNGTFRLFNHMASSEKWLRIHNTQEWPDQYTPQYRDDLCRFFDHYLKGIDNGWETTPKVRMSVLNESGPDIVDRVEESFPPARVKYKKLYLNDDLTLSDEASKQRGTISYEVGEASDGNVTFRMKFSEDTELSGYFRLRLFMKTDEGDDMDVFCFAGKEDSSGIPVRRRILGAPFLGASGRIRASHRAIEIGTPAMDDYNLDHTNEHMIAPEEIVELDIAMWPLAMLWKAGEILTLTISAGDLQKTEFDSPPIQTINKGIHTILTGGDHASYLMVPQV